ncbi:MAG: cytochrome c [Pedobacter sp.]|nr:MAG: cytochrome c [Pedobacter sp.]
MKKLSVITVFLLAIIIWSCGGSKQERSRNYMPDMMDSRAYETYANLDTLKSQGINYTAMPVAGTVKRGELYPFPLAADKFGDSTNYVASRQVPNPITALTEDQSKEAERLYLVNCGICHGGNLNGNGPLYNDGTGPYGVAPRNLVDDPVVTGMPDGQMFYSISYGKGQMGPYASQLTTTQRWMVVRFIRDKQIQKKGGSAPKAQGTDSLQSAGTPPKTTSPVGIPKDSAQTKK